MKMMLEVFAVTTINFLGKMAEVSGKQMLRVIGSVRERRR
jgi:hypothetical protein